MPIPRFEELAEKLVTILRGPSGSGKSLWASGYHWAGHPANKNAFVVSADHYFVDDEGNYSFDPSMLPIAHSACMSTFLDALAKGRPHIIVDNTNMQEWEWENYARAAQLAGYDVHIVEFMPRTREELLLCIGRNSHGVPAMGVAGMWLRFEEVSDGIKSDLSLSNSDIRRIPVLTDTADAPEQQ